MADLGFADFIEYFNKDPHTSKIILYIEKIKKGREFIRVCRNSKKQIIAVKAGKSSEGKEAAISHTGSLATDFEIYRGAFRQARVKLADSLADALGLKTEFPKLKKGKTAIVTNAGGAGALMADILSEKGIKADKPTDIIGTALPEDYEKTINNLKSSNIIVILTPQTMSQPEATAKLLVKSKNKKKITAFFLGEKSVTKARNILKKAGIPCYTKI